MVLPDPVPGQTGKVGTTRLGFDPAVSSHFHVFELAPAAALNANVKFDYNIKISALKIISKKKYYLAISFGIATVVEILLYDQNQSR